MSSIRVLLLGLFTLSSCAPTAGLSPVSVPESGVEQTAARLESPDEESNTSGPEQQSERAESLPAVVSPTQERESEAAAWVSYSMSFQVTTKDPIAAVAAVNSALTDLGAEVNSSSSAETYGQVHASFPARVRPRVREALVGLHLVITSESVSRNDMSATVRETEERLSRIDLAREHVMEAVRRTSNDQRHEALLILLDMTENERRNLESQLRSYRTQLDQNNVSVSFSKPNP